MSSEQKAVSRGKLVYHRLGATYAIEESSKEFVHVEDVSNGKACGCICADCFSPLLARANDDEKEYQKSPHFAHQSLSNCVPTGDRDLVLAAKELLTTTAPLRIPSPIYSIDPESKSISVTEGSLLVSPSKVELVDGLNKAPDLLLTIPQCVLRLVISAKKITAMKYEAKGKELNQNILSVNIHPDAKGCIFMEDLREALEKPSGVLNSVSWHHQTLTVEYVEQVRRKFDEDKKRIRDIQASRESIQLHFNSGVVPLPPERWGDRCARLSQVAQVWLGSLADIVKREGIIVPPYPISKPDGSTAGFYANRESPWHCPITFVEVIADGIFALPDIRARTQQSQLRIVCVTPSHLSYEHCQEFAEKKGRVHMESVLKLTLDSGEFDRFDEQAITALVKSSSSYSWLFNIRAESRSPRAPDSWPRLR